MFKLPCLTLLVLCFCPVIVSAQDIGDSLEISVRPYAGLRGHLAVYDDGMEVQGKMSRAIKSKAYLLWG